MAVVAYLGVPGSGKSLHVMKDLYYKSRQRDALILTNFDVALPRRARATWKRLPEGKVEVSHVLSAFGEWLDEGHKVTHEGQVLLVIDEAQISFSNRAWNEAGRMEWIRLFVQHRKLGMSVVLIVQDLGMIDKQIRAVVETSGHHIRANSYGVWGDVVSLLTLGRPLCMCVYKLPFYGASKSGVIGREAIMGRRRYYRMYDTHAMFSEDLMLGDVWQEPKSK